MGFKKIALVGFVALSLGLTGAYAAPKGNANGYGSNNGNGGQNGNGNAYGATGGSNSGNSSTGSGQGGLASGVQRSTVTIKNTNLLNTLNLNSNIVISAQDVTDAKVDGVDKTFDLGTFCTYTNDLDKTMQLTATNNEGGFIMKGQNGLGDVDYNVKFNSQNVKYGEALNFKQQGDNNHVDCNNPEKIEVTVDAAKLAAAKAGTYDVSLNLATANL
ncbi:hypothetical protein OAO18_08975 [Francisellaceae bacterium]|nr:hypothetical protein [Francisellaceae bacterium]